MSQGTQTGVLNQPRGVRWGGRWEGDSRGRGVSTPMADSCWCLKEITKSCKAIILKLKNKINFKKYNVVVKKKKNGQRSCGTCTRWNIQFSYKKECNWISSNEEDEPRVYYTEWSKLEREGQVSYIKAHIWNLERWYWWSYLQVSTGDTDI